ncbi:MAG: hypothetical protein ACE15E_06980 [Acidobacteriota bacterium]
MPRIDEIRAELAAVLSSKYFSRAPTLVQFLSYVCEKYFQGEAAQIKEYTVAVEAFGRPESFEPKRDPIVRVDANRLRLRLLKYYRHEGRNHAIRIWLPTGQYVPVFEFCAQVADKGEVLVPGGAGLVAPGVQGHAPGGNGVGRTSPDQSPADLATSPSNSSHSHRKISTLVYPLA